MKIQFVSLLFLLFSIQLAAQQKSAFPSFEAAPLRAVLLYLESNHDLAFSYRDNNVEEYSISLSPGEYQLKDYLHLVFGQTNLVHEFIDDRYIILTQKIGTSDQPGFFCGYIQDNETGQLLSYANILIKNKGSGATSSKTGRFELSNVAKGDTLLISYVGYQRLQVIIDQTNSESCPTFTLTVQSNEIEPVLVTVYLMDGVLQDKKGQKILIKPKKLSIFPGSIEPDIMTSIQMLPGVFSADETASGLNIRGGTGDQNLILWDGIPIYHTGHFFGMISAFNPYIVDQVDVYRSGMDAEYGGRVSGVIDIKTNSERPKKFNLDLGFNLTHGHINTHIPLWKKSSMTLSFRRSLRDVFRSPTFRSYSEKVFQGSRLDDEQAPANQIFEPINDYFFGDFNFKWNWKPGKNNFGIDMFSGQNHLEYVSDIPQFEAIGIDSFNLENIGFSLYWGREWNKKFSSLIRMTSSNFNYQYSFSAAFRAAPEFEVVRTELQNNLQDGGLSWTNTWKLQKNHQLKFGLQFTDADIDLSNREKDFFRLIDTTITQPFEHRMSNLFTDYQISLANVLELEVGLRYQYQNIIKNYYFEPRVALTAIVNPNLKLKLSTGKQFQFISQLVILDIENLDFANQIWIASDNKIVPVIESNQWAGGIMYTKNGWKIDLEGYVKELAGITSLSTNFSNNTAQPYSQGDSRTRGIDVLVQRQFNDTYRSWLSYTLSQTVYEFSSLSTNIFPASHDQRHTLQWVNLFNAKPWEFAIGWKFGSGLPYTKMNGTEFVIPQNPENIYPRILYEDINSSRLLPYHRLDASAMYSFKDKKSFKGSLGLSLINIYNRENILGKKFVIEDASFDENRIDVSTINEAGLRFTPNFVLRLQW